MRRVVLLSCVIFLLGARASTQEATPPTASPDVAGLHQRLVTIVLTAPAGTPGTQLTDTPPAVAALVKEGWQVGLCTSLGPSPDGKGFVVALTLDRSDAITPDQHVDRHQDTNQPGRADPVAPAKSGSIHLSWDNGNQTTVVIGQPQGVRNPATVSTADKEGNAQVTYPATAFVDAQGTIHIDGRGAPLAGPQANAYSPDSFAIHQDGTVATLDDKGDHEQAILVLDTPGKKRDPKDTSDL